MLALVAPFLINCAIATGDPLLAINHHTDFYLKREGVADPPPKSAVVYALEKFERPLAAADTMVNGIFVYPFTNKWVGLDAWFPGLGQVLSWLAIGGMIGWLWRRDGRLSVVRCFWDRSSRSVRRGQSGEARSGGSPFLLILSTLSPLSGLWSNSFDSLDSQLRRPAPQKTIWRAVAVTVIARRGRVLDILHAVRGRSRVTRPRSRHHDSRGATRPFHLVDGWSDLVVTGNVTSRFSIEPSAAIRLSLPQPRPYTLLMRMDPLHYPGASQQRVHVSLNGQPVSVLDLGWNPERVGEYTVVLASDGGTARIECAHVAVGADGADRKSRQGIIRRSRAIAR